MNDTDLDQRSGIAEPSDPEKREFAFQRNDRQERHMPKLMVLRRERCRRSDKRKKHRGGARLTHRPEAKCLRHGRDRNEIRVCLPYRRQQMPAWFLSLPLGHCASRVWTLFWDTQK